MAFTDFMGCLVAFFRLEVTEIHLLQRQYCFITYQQFFNVRTYFSLARRLSCCGGFDKKEKEFGCCQSPFYACPAVDKMENEFSGADQFACRYTITIRHHPRRHKAHSADVPAPHPIAFIKRKSALIHPIRALNELHCSE